uniref:Uncharacterized protein n=1 Tax=Vespula pensylvanica TaxID=30213 RepID=A0A834PFA6_VESPE|nr:hypothetical protein H0235_001029 [Vespula pensylvanica]
MPGVTSRCVGAWICVYICMRNMATAASGLEINDLHLRLRNSANNVHSQQQYMYCYNINDIIAREVDRSSVKSKRSTIIEDRIQRHVFSFPQSRNWLRTLESAGTLWLLRWEPKRVLSIIEVEAFQLIA